MEENIREGKISIAALIMKLIIDSFACCILIGFIWLIKDIITFITTKLIITNKNINGKTGLFNTNELNSPLNKISGVQVQQGIFGKIFNYGNIVITTASTKFQFKYINKPNEFRNALNYQIEKYEEERIEEQAKKMAEAMKQN